MQQLAVLVVLLCLVYGSDGRPQANYASEVGAALSSSSSDAPYSLDDESIANLSRFETYGPTMTITLRDPITSSRSSRKIKPISTSKALVSSENSMSIDSQFEGLAAKLAARFHISSETSSSVEPKQTPPQFINGYMLDGGNVMLGPPSDSKHDQPAKQFFPLLGGLGSVPRWSDCVKSIQPELAYEVRSRATSNNIEDTRPFPGTLPWVNAVSCGLKWRPFPTYKPGEGYGHKLMSAPHYVRCGASISFPRVSKILRPWKSAGGDELSCNDLSRKRSLDMDLTYLDDSSRKGGRVEVLLGKSSPHLRPQSSDQTQYSRRNNHVLACFATGKGSSQPSLSSSIEYIRGSIYVPLPAFLHKRSKGLSLSPSYDFIEGKARLCASGDVGTAGRTSAVLRLDSDDSTLTLVRALDDR